MNELLRRRDPIVPLSVARAALAVSLDVRRPPLAEALGAAWFGFVAIGCGANDPLWVPNVTHTDAGPGGSEEFCAVDRGGGRCPIGSVLIPAGTFRMGTSDPDRPHDGPEHFVSLDAFCIDTHEVTLERYTNGREVCRKGCETPDPDMNFGDPTFPVVWLPAPVASTFCASACGRLPTEAEWERTARGLEGRRFPWGDEPPDSSRLIWSGVHMRLEPGSVGMFPAGATPEGVFDLAGNVAEWVSDLMGPYPSTPQRNPTGAPPKESIFDDVAVLRGGGWTAFRVEDVEASHRDGHQSIGRGNDFGFRCAYEPSPP